MPSDSLSPPSSSNTRPDQSRPDLGCSEYQTYQSYPDPPISGAFTTSIDQPTPTTVPVLYPVPCHKFSYCTTISLTPTVITHTASTVGVLGSAHQANSYPHAGHAYPQMPSHSLSYQADPVHAVPPPMAAAHCFSVPEQMAAAGVRGKHKQKTGGLSATGTPSIHAPTPTSCLAKLLSSSTHERESVLSFQSILTESGKE